MNTGQTSTGPGSRQTTIRPERRQGTQWIVARLGDAEYVIRSAQIAQIEMIERITAVPNAPDFVRGVAYLRGEVVPIVDLRVRLGLPAVEMGLATRVIVVDVAGRRVGLLVDQAREVIYAEESEILPPPEATTAAGTRAIEGIIAVGERLLLVLDPSIILHDDAVGARDPRERASLGSEGRGEDDGN